jgi:hypothetical protein
MGSRRTITLTTITTTFVPFGLGVSAALLAAEMTQSLTHARLIYSIWVSLALATPALCLYVLPARSEERRGYWLLFWTFSYVAYLVHFYYAFILTYHASIPELYVNQRVLIATSNLIVTALWGIDVLLGWVADPNARSVRIVTAAAHLLVFVTFFASSVLIFGGPGRLFGLAMTAAVAACLLYRIAVRLFAHDVASPPPADVGVRVPPDAYPSPSPSVPHPYHPDWSGGASAGGGAMGAGTQTLTATEPATYTATTTGAASAAPRPANLAPTRIMDWNATAIQTLADRLAQHTSGQREYVQHAHRYLATEMRAVYSIDEEQPASETLRVNGGSCSQRMACLEALARARGVPTRVRSLWLRKEFWFSRLPLLRFTMPKRTLMPWPQFYLDDAWVDMSELFATIPELTVQATHPFTNRGESLYSAVEHAPVDFWGKSQAIAGGRFDLRRFVAAEGALFDTRDELMAMAGGHVKALGRLIFAILYGGRPIRRVKED